MQIKYYSGFQVISILHEIGGDKMLETIERFAKEPTADVVEVVRCKDCRHYKIGSDNMHYCFMNDSDHLWQDDDYCSYGERREDE